MRLYAVRDRLIDYFMTPFAAPSDKEVLASLANTINNPENLSAIAQSPHHFEIWRLAEVDEETGDLKQSREFLADCSTLLRPGRAAAEPGKGQDQAPTGGRTSSPGGAPASPRANPRPNANAPRADAGAATEAHPAPGGVPAAQQGSGSLRNS